MTYVASIELVYTLRILVSKIRSYLREVELIRTVSYDLENCEEYQVVVFSRKLHTYVNIYCSDKYHRKVAPLSQRQYQRD